MPALTPGSKVLVTGGNGYIGAAVVKLLLEQGFSVRAAVRSEEKAAPVRDFFKSYVDSGKLEFVIIPAFETAGAFDEAVKGVDGIAHLASPVAGVGGIPSEWVKPAVEGTLSLLKSAAQPGVAIKRIVYTSSITAVTGETSLRLLKEPTVFDESHWSDDPEWFEKQGDAADLVVKYGSSKVLAEKAAWDFWKSNKSTLTWDLVSLALPLSLGESLFGPIGGSVYWWYNIAVKGGASDEGTLKAAYSYVALKDAVKAHLLALTVEAAGGERFITAAGVTTWQDTINFVQALPNKPELKTPYTKGIPELKPEILATYNSEKSKKILGLEYEEYGAYVNDILKELARQGF